MDDICHILEQYPADCRPDRIEPLGSAGGLSGAQFWRVTAPRGVLALRRWPPEHPSAERLRFIHAVINHAAANGVSYVPMPIRALDGHTFLSQSDHFWELAPWMPGDADYERAPSDEKLAAAMITLARFHNSVADYSLPPERETTLHTPGLSAIPRRIDRLRRLHQGDIKKLNNAIDDAIWPEFALVAREFLTQLPNAVPRALALLEPLANANFPLQPCVRDIWHDHILFTGNDVTGIVDFGAVDFDIPATDIARLLGSLVGEPGLPFKNKTLELEDRSNCWKKGLTAYSSVRRLSSSETLAVRALSSANPILAGCNWIRWGFVDRRQFQDGHKIVVRFKRILSHLTDSPPLTV
jgi:Ser/Thr protein kinase RdoA (MazF antagonist)